MSTNKKISEAVQVGGGATGASTVPDPENKKANLPASNLNNGEPMSKVANVTPGQGEEETRAVSNTLPAGNAAANAATIKAKGAVKEDMDALFNGEDLSESFKEKASTIYEAAVNLRVEAIRQEMQEQQDQIIEQRVVAFAESMEDTLEKYLSYVAEQWLEDNTVAIEHSLRAEITEGFIDGLRNLFMENNFNIPQEQLDVVEGLASQVQDLEQKLDESINVNAELRALVEESEKEKKFGEVAEGLADTQIAKLRALAEGIDYDNAETFGHKLHLIKESYFNTNAKAGPSSVNVLTESIDEPVVEQQPSLDPSMAKYVSAISRTQTKN